jgi:REP element-mobilizing transposase RayT
VVLPDGDADFATRRRLIKSGFSRALPSGEPISASRAAKAERGIWQRRYWEHTLRDEDDFSRHLDYIHFSPRPGLAIFLASPLGAPQRLSAGLGRRSRR